MGAAALRTENLTKRFNHLLAVDTLDLSVSPGEVFGFLGPNGAGKSTTIRMVLGMVRPTAGRAWVFDTDAADVARAHRLLAHVPADVALWPRLTGAETLELLGRTGPGVDVAYRDELVERFALDPSRPAGTYSTGNRQKVALVAAFATRAPLLVLDEPTSGLDPLMEREFRRAVREARDRGSSRRTARLARNTRHAHRRRGSDRGGTVGIPATRPARVVSVGVGTPVDGRGTALLSRTGPPRTGPRPGPGRRAVGTSSGIAERVGAAHLVPAVTRYGLIVAPVCVALAVPYLWLRFFAF